MTEEEIHTKSHEYAKKHVRYFLLEGRTLLTILDGGLSGVGSGADKGSEEVLIIARDATGKYCWRVRSVDDATAQAKPEDGSEPGAGDQRLSGDVGGGADRPSVGGGADRSSVGPEFSSGLPPALSAPGADPLAAALEQLEPEGMEGSGSGGDGTVTPSSVIDFLEGCAVKEEANASSGVGVVAGSKAGKGKEGSAEASAPGLGEGQGFYELFSWHNTRRLLSQLGFLNVETWGRLEILDGTKQLVSKIVGELRRRAHGISTPASGTPVHRVVAANTAASFAPRSSGRHPREGPVRVLDVEVCERRGGRQGEDQDSRLR